MGCPLCSEESLAVRTPFGPRCSACGRLPFFKADLYMALMTAGGAGAIVAAIAMLAALALLNLLVEIAILVAFYALLGLTLMASLGARRELFERLPRNGDAGG